MTAWTKETARRFRSAKVVVLTLEAGTFGALCARSECGTLLAIGTRAEFAAIAHRVSASLIDRATQPFALAAPARTSREVGPFGVVSTHTVTISAAESTYRVKVTLSSDRASSSVFTDDGQCLGSVDTDGAVTAWDQNLDIVQRAHRAAVAFLAQEHQ